MYLPKSATIDVTQVQFLSRYGLNSKFSFLAQSALLFIHS